jgi:hypothetical protein
MARNRNRSRSRPQPRPAPAPIPRMRLRVLPRWPNPCPNCVFLGPAIPGSQYDGYACREHPSYGTAAIVLGYQSGGPNGSPVFSICWLTEHYSLRLRPWAPVYRKAVRFGLVPPATT